MRKKLNNESGLTLVEMLAATAIMVLLTLMLGTGTQMAMNAYQTSVAQNELELLLSTTVDALTDELRYARDVVARDPDEVHQGEANFEYTSDTYGHETILKWNNTAEKTANQLMANSRESQAVVDGEILYPDGYRVLSTGAYGSSTAYKDYKLVTGTNDTYINYDNGIFTVKLTVATSDTAGKSISAATPEMTIRCLSPQAAPTPEPDT